FDIDSIPPVTITSCSPARIIASAISTARRDEAQTLLIVSAGTWIGSPAPTAAWRAGAWPAPACSTWPMITYSTSCGSSPIFSSAERITIEPSPVACCLARPPPSLPNGVRSAATMTERATPSMLPSEGQAGLQPPQEGDRQPNSRLDVVEVAQLDRRVHVAERDRDEPGRDAGSAQVRRVGVGHRDAAGDLDRVRDPLRLGALDQQLGDARMDDRAAEDRRPAAELVLAVLTRIGAGNVARRGHVGGGGER